MKELSQPTSSVTPGTISTRATGRCFGPLAAAVAVALAAPPVLASEPVAVPPALAARVIEAYGGATALAKARAVRQTGSVTALAQGGKVGELERILTLPESLRVEIAYPGEPHEVRVNHAGKGVRDGQDVTGTVPHHAMVLQVARLALPFWVAAGDPRVRYLGTYQRDSRTLETLYVRLPGGLELAADVDPASGHIMRTVGRIPVGGERLEFVNTYSDFRKVRGVAFAHREENFARGVHTGDTVLKRIEVLDAAPPGAFDARPRGAERGEKL